MTDETRIYVVDFMQKEIEIAKTTAMQLSYDAIANGCVESYIKGAEKAVEKVAFLSMLLEKIVRDLDKE